LTAKHRDVRWRGGDETKSPPPPPCRPPPVLPAPPPRPPPPPRGAPPREAGEVAPRQPAPRLPRPPPPPVQPPAQSQPARPRRGKSIRLQHVPPLEKGEALSVGSRQFDVGCDHWRGLSTLLGAGGFLHLASLQRRRFRCHAPPPRCMVVLSLPGPAWSS